VPFEEFGEDLGLFSRIVERVMCVDPVRYQIGYQLRATRLGDWATSFDGKCRFDIKAPGMVER
jgi:hypothetical protein